MINFRGNLGRGDAHLRKQMQGMSWSGLFGMPSDMSESEQGALIRRQVEAQRGGAKDSTGSASVTANFEKMYVEDKSNEVFYTYENRINDSYQEPSSKRIPASQLLKGRITRANPPRFYTENGLVWRRDG